MKIKLTDGPLKGQVVHISDRSIEQRYIRVAERTSRKDIDLNFHGPVDDAVSTHIYRVDELWCDGAPINRFEIKYVKPVI